METNYKGIDYGLGQANIDKETGIRYGVINQNEVGQAWFESSEVVYPNEVFCPECGNELTLVSEGKSEQLPDSQGVSVEDDTYHCDHCDQDIYSSDINMEIDPVGFVFEEDGYVCSQSADDTDIFVTKSPYFTYCQFCSPCAPGAGYIMNTVENGVKAYCLGHDWFEDNKAPYPVYSVETGELINK